MPDNFKLLNESFNEAGSPVEAHGGFHEFDALSRIEGQSQPRPSDTENSPSYAEREASKVRFDVPEPRPQMSPTQETDGRAHEVEPPPKAVFVKKAIPLGDSASRGVETSFVSNPDQQWKHTPLKQLLSSLRASPQSRHSTQRRLHGVFRR